MATKPITSPLPANLPENWTIGQTVAPSGAEVGLGETYGYNYLMEQVNAAQKAVNTINNAFEGLPSQEDVDDLLENGTITAVQVTASASGWAGSPAAQTLSIAGMTADSLYWVGLNSTATYAQRDAARKAVIAPTAQGTSSLTLTCDGVTPTVDLPILVFLSGGAA